VCPQLPEGVYVDLGAVFFHELSRPLVVCDIDNTLAFHAEAICCALNARFGTNRTPATLTAYPFGSFLPPDEAAWLARFCARDAWAANMAPDLRAIEALNAIHAAGHPVTVASDRNPLIADATRDWLDAWGVQRDGSVLEGPGSKRTALASCGPGSPAVLVDDDPRQWLLAARAGVEVWSPRRPWTPAGWESYRNVRVFTGWSEPLGWLGIG
jgi:hypothetical protein